MWIRRRDYDVLVAKLRDFEGGDGFNAVMLRQTQGALQHTDEHWTRDRERADRAERQLRRAREDGVQLEATNDQLSSELMIARRELATERAKREAAERAATIAQNNFEWCRLSLNTAEQRSAELMAHVLKGPITAALHIARTETTRADAKDVLGMGLPSSGELHFEDIGDEAARAEGAHWDSEGVVNYDSNGHEPVAE